MRARALLPAARLDERQVPVRPTLGFVMHGPFLLQKLEQLEDRRVGRPVTQSLADLGDGARPLAPQHAHDVQFAPVKAGPSTAGRSGRDVAFLRFVIRETSTDLEYTEKPTIDVGLSLSFTPHRLPFAPHGPRPQAIDEPEHHVAAQ
jgi:hypothetical protein